MQLDIPLDEPEGNIVNINNKYSWAANINLCSICKLVDTAFNQQKSLNIRKPNIASNPLLLAQRCGGVAAHLSTDHLTAAGELRKIWRADQRRTAAHGASPNALSGHQEIKETSCLHHEKLAVSHH